MASELFFDQVFQCGVLQRQISIHPLELGVFLFHFAQSLQFIRAHTAILALPVVEAGFADAVLAANFFDRQARIDLVQYRDDLRFRES